MGQQEVEHSAVKDGIGRRLREQMGWPPDAFRLTPVLEWPEPRLPLWVALPLRPSSASSPVFAVLPDGSLVGSDERGALERIVGTVYGELTARDAPRIAQLAVYFRALGADAPHGTGELADAIPVRFSASRLPRPTAEVVYERDEAAHVIRFYTCDYELMRLFDCELRIDGGRITSAVHPVTAEQNP